VNIFEVFIVHNTIFICKQNRLHLRATYYEGRGLKK
jgi:hypothetical protein